MNLHHQFSIIFHFCYHYSHSNPSIKNELIILNVHQKNLLVSIAVSSCVC